MEGPERENDVETSSDEGESEKLIDGKIRKLILEAEANPFQYDKHVELITALRAAGDLDQLRQARESMAAIYPLSEELWLEWFQDELPLAIIPEQKQYIISKFAAAVKDYASIKVWHEYCQYMMNNIDSPSDIDRARNVFEQAITAVGLHVTEGASIWTGYREFEIAILDSYQQLQDSGDTLGMEAKVESQIERIAAIYKRQLSIPLLGLDETYKSFEDWYSDEIPDELNRMYERASQKLSLLMEHEEKLLSAEGSKLSEYASYISYEITAGDPARTQSIFERAIKDNCLQADLWERYTKYLDFKLKIPSIAVNIHERAVRNCPWVSKLWQNYLKALERNNTDLDTYIKAFDQSMKGGFNGADSYLQIWLTRCDYHRRRISNWSFEEDRIEELHKAFENGVTYMNHYFGLEGDKYCLLLREWAFIEAKYLQNIKRAQELWDTVMKKHSRDAGMWLEYVHFLMLFTDVATVRRIFQRSVQINMEQPEVICDAFIKFERHYGNLSDMDDAQMKIDLQMKKVKERREKDAIKDASIVFCDTRKKGKLKFGKNAEREELGKKKKKKKRENGKYSLKRNNESKPEMEPEIKKVLAEPDSENLICMETSQFPLLPSLGHTDKKDVKSASEIEQINSLEIHSENNTHSKDNPETLNTFTDEEITSLTNAMLIDKNDKGDGLKEKSDFAGEKIEDNFDTSDKVDNKKSVFLSNLLFTVEESHIREMFTPCGEIGRIHIVFNKAGKSKGFAYLEFKEKESVEKALKLDRETILGRPIFVSECVNKKENPTQFKFPITLDKHTVFVSNLPFELNSEQVKEHFAQAGDIKQVRLVTNRSGKSKGFAYVEYESETAATSAILKLDKQQLNGRNINVALSNPPARKQNEYLQQQSKQKAPDVPPGSRGKSKTQVSLVPRALQKIMTAENSSSETASGSKETTSGSAEKSSSAMSNSDFRKFLAK